MWINTMLATGTPKHTRQGDFFLDRLAESREPVALPGPDANRQRFSPKSASKMLMVPQ